MTLANAIDVVIAQTEKAIRINADNRASALADGDLRRYDQFAAFAKQLNSLHSKFIVARAEITNLAIYGCSAI